MRPLPPRDARVGAHEERDVAPSAGSDDALRGLRAVPAGAVRARLDDAVADPPRRRRIGKRVVCRTAPAEQVKERAGHVGHRSSHHPVRISHDHVFHHHMSGRLF